MKKYAAIITSLTALVLLSQTNLFNDILMFVLVGAVPGTTHSIPASVMLALVGSASWVFILQFKSARRLSRYIIKKVYTLYTAHKQNITERLLGHA
jgi:hypothetical protein